MAPADLTTSQTATQINANTFEALARGRRFHTILMMAPGVRHEIEGGKQRCRRNLRRRRERRSENSYFIDGVEVRDV